MGKSVGSAWSSLAVLSSFRGPPAGPGVFRDNLMDAVCPSQAISVAQADHDGPSCRQSVMIHGMTGVNGRRDLFSMQAEHSLWDTGGAATSSPNKDGAHGQMDFTKTHSFCSLFPLPIQMGQLMHGYR